MEKHKDDFYFKFIVDVLVLLNKVIPKEVLKEAAVVAENKIMIEKALNG